jgi:hypothetical protein
MLHSVRAKFGERLGHQWPQIRCSDILAIQMVNGRVCDVVYVLLCLEPLKLNPDLPGIGGSDSAVIDLGARLLKKLEQSDRLKVSYHTNVLRNEVDAPAARPPNQEAKNQTPKRGRRADKVTIPKIDYHFIRNCVARVEWHDAAWKLPRMLEMVRDPDHQLVTLLTLFANGGNERTAMCISPPRRRQLTQN